MWPNSNNHSQGGRKMKRILTVVLAALLIFTPGGSRFAQYKATMKLASVTPVDHFYNVGAQEVRRADQREDRRPNRNQGLPRRAAGQRRAGDHRSHPTGRGRPAHNLHRSPGRVQSVHQCPGLPVPLPGFQPCGLGDGRRRSAASCSTTLRRPKSRPWRSGKTVSAT